MSLDKESIRGMLGYLAQNKEGLELLQYFCEHALDHEFRKNDDDWTFRLTVLEAKDIIPEAFRIKLWHHWCLQQENLFGVPVSKACLQNCQTLIDDANVRMEYCRLRMTGHKYLRNIDSLDRPTEGNVEWVMESAAEDSVPQFGIAFSMYASERFNKKIVWELAKANAAQCLIWLMGKCKNFFNIFPVKEMLCFACANMREEMGIPIIKYIAKRFPEKVATCVDELGNNLLWYLLHNRYAAWWRPDCGMARALVKAGCNPDSLNHLDLSFNKIVHNVSKEQRKELEEQLKENLS